jgi:hypothetical protein
VLAFLLEGGIVGLMPKELLKRGVEVGKRLLVGILVDLIDPGVLLALEGIPLHFELRRRGLLATAVLALPLRERPVIGKPGNPRRFAAVRFLRLGEVEGNLMSEDHMCLCWVYYGHN